MVDSNRRTLQV